MKGIQTRCSAIAERPALQGELYTVSQKKTSPTLFAITRESIDGFLQYLAEMLLRKQAIICCYIFPPHLINACTLPCETENTEIVSFHLNVACLFANRHASHIGIITK